MTISGADAVWRGATLAAHAAERPAAPAVILPGRVIDWAAFYRQVQAAAGRLHDSGIGQDMPVAITMRRTPEHLAALFALQRLGAGVLLIDADEPAELQRALRAQIAARHAVGADGPIGEAIAVPVPAFGVTGGDAPTPAPPLDSVCFFGRSSGTTHGVPKLTPLTHRHEWIRGEANGIAMPRAPDDRYLALLVLSFAFGCRSAQRALLNGGAVILPPPMRRVDDLRAVAIEHGATWTALTPHHLREMLSTATAPFPAFGRIAILVSTAALTVPERLAVMERISPELYMSYGANEVGGVVFAKPEDLRRHPGTVGRPLPGYEAEVVDDSGHAVPADAVGELRFRHETFPKGYVAPLPGATSRFHDGWFHPGDLGTIDADGLIFLKGRADDLINVGGRKVYPGDIEECLARHPTVVEAAAFGVAATKRGEMAIAAVVLRAPTTAIALREHCRAALGADRTPGRILIVEAIPRTPIGKPDKRALRTLLIADDASRSRQRAVSRTGRIESDE